MSTFLLLFAVFCLSVALLGLRHCRKSSPFYRLNDLPPTLTTQAE